MRTFCFSLCLVAVGCGGAQKPSTADQLLVQTDATIEMIENIAVEGIHRAHETAMKKCAGNSHYDETMCIEAAVTPWFVLLESVRSAQDALLFAYRVRRDGGNAANALACSREAMTIVVRRLKDLKTNPPAEFADFVVSIIKAANGARCVQDAN